MLVINGFATKRLQEFEKLSYLSTLSANELKSSAVFNIAVPQAAIRVSSLQGEDIMMPLETLFSSYIFSATGLNICPPLAQVTTNSESFSFTM